MSNEQKIVTFEGKPSLDLELGTRDSSDDDMIDINDQ